jgi:hypothetical protein
VNGRSVGRRDAAAGGIAMLVLAAAAAGGAKAEELDGHLLALCREIADVSGETNRISDALADMPSRELAAHPLRVRESELSDRFCELRELIADMPARTPEGIRAKACVVLAEFRGEDEWEKYPGQYDPRGSLALSLARDLLGRAAV